MSQVASLKEQVQEGPASPKYGASAPIVAEEEEPSCGQEEHTPTPRYAPLSPQYTAPVETVSDGKLVSDKKRSERADDARDWQEEARFRREEAGLQPDQEDDEVFDKEEPLSRPLKKQSTVIDEKLHVYVE